MDLRAAMSISEPRSSSTSRSTMRIVPLVSMCPLKCATESVSQSQPARGGFFAYLGEASLQRMSKSCSTSWPCRLMSLSRLITASPNKFAIVLRVDALTSHRVSSSCDTCGSSTRMANCSFQTKLEPYDWGGTPVVRLPAALQKTHSSSQQCILATAIALTSARKAIG